MKNIFTNKNFIKWSIIVVLIIAIGVGVFFVSRSITQNRQQHQELRADIENIYYYLKQESKDLYLFSNLKDGDSVALSAWHNSQSSTASQVKNYEKMFSLHEKKSQQFKEVALIPDIQSYIQEFSNLAAYISLRVESPSDFSDDTYIQMRDKLNQNLAAFAEKAKAYNIDLR